MYISAIYLTETAQDIIEKINSFIRPLRKIL